ncbi:MAG TPA: alcohol dehydrogenase catalytic domain-containing protein [Thermoleophilaceae bacterium]
MGSRSPRCQIRSQVRESFRFDVTHAAVGLVDVFIRQGLYKDREGLPQPPYVPGLEVAGTVRELGDGVDGFTVGEPVVTVSGTGPEGGYAAISVVDARFAVSLGSSGIDLALAVATVPNAATAYLALTRVAHLQSGETVLVHGALGGLASTFPGIASSLGASTIVGTVRPTSLPTAEASELPYNRLIGSDEFPDALIDERFDVVIDPVGGDVRTTSLGVTGSARATAGRRQRQPRLAAQRRDKPPLGLQSRGPRLQRRFVSNRATPAHVVQQRHEPIGGGPRNARNLQLPREIDRQRHVCWSR